MQKVHYDQWLSGGISCGRQNYDHAHEDISKVTCQDCLRANKRVQRTAGTYRQKSKSESKASSAKVAGSPSGG